MVAVLAVVVLAVVFLVLRGGEGASVGENAIGSAFSPLQNAFSSATKWVRDLFQGWRNYDELEANYQELFLENQQLSLELQSAEEALVENQRLLGLLDAQERYEELDPIYARVIARDPGQWFDTFSVNRGTNDGVSVGMAVVTGDGLVGRVYEAGLNYAKVLTIIDSRSAVSCLIERTRDNGVMRGQITATSESAECYVNYVQNIANIVPGDTLITSGTDSLYPKGIQVGTVTAVSRATDTAGSYVIAMPSVDFQHIEEVLVLRTVVETDEEQGLPVVTTPTPVPVRTATPAPSAAASEAQTDENIFVFPTAIPEGGAPTGPVYEDLPEDIWAESWNDQNISLIRREDDRAQAHMAGGTHAAFADGGYIGHPLPRQQSLHRLAYVHHRAGHGRTP